MTAIATTNIRFLHSDNFIRSIKNVDQLLYIFVGKDTAWESTAPTPTNTYDRFLEDSADITYLTRVYYNNLSRVMKHVEYTSGTLYTMYDDGVAIIGTNYFVVNGSNVYKCLDNNDGANSTVAPTSVSTSGVESTSDGYVWKYMYTIPTEWGEKIETPSSNWIKIDKVDTRSENTTQWDVRANAKPGGIHAFKKAGAIPSDLLTVDNTVTVVGDGTGFSGIIKEVNGVKKIVCDSNYNNSANSGSKYNVVTKVLVNGNEEHNSVPIINYFRPIISPPGGHGSDPIRELDGYYVLVTADFLVPDNTNTTYRKIGLITNPLRKTKSDGSTDNHLSYVSGDNYLLGERLGAKAVTGSSDYLRYSGEIIYIDNREEAKTLTSSSTNEIKLILSF